MGPQRLVSVFSGASAAARKTTAKTSSIPMLKRTTARSTKQISLCPPFPVTNSATAPPLSTELLLMKQQKQLANVAEPTRKRWRIDESITTYLYLRASRQA